MTLLRALLRHTALATDLHWLLLTLGVTHKLTIALVNVPGAAAALIHCPALLRPLSIAHLLQRSVTLANSFFLSLLLEHNVAHFLKVLLARLLLGRFEECDVGVVTLLYILVFTLQDWILGQSLHCLILDNTKTTICSSGGLTEVNSSSRSILFLLSRELWSRSC